MSYAAINLPEHFGTNLVAIVLYAIVGIVLMFAAFWAIDFTTPGPLAALVRDGKPNAVVVTAAGMLSMSFIIITAIHNSGGDLGGGLISALVLGLIGITAQVLAVRMVDWATRIEIGKTIEMETFAPGSLVVAATQIALSLIIAVSIAP